MKKNIKVLNQWMYFMSRTTGEYTSGMAVVANTTLSGS